jgi:hypothetical protein
LGVGRLQKKVNITKVEPTPIQSVATPAPVAVESEMQNMVDDFKQEVMASAAEEVGNEVSIASNEIAFVPLPGASPVEPIAEEVVDDSTIESTFDNSQPSSDDSNNVSLPEPEVEEVPERSDVEIEFRELVSGLMAAGIEPTEMMNDPRWEDLSERALAIGFETWPVFLQLTAME